MRRSAGLSLEPRNREKMGADENHKMKGWGLPGRICGYDPLEIPSPLPWLNLV